MEQRVCALHSECCCPSCCLREQLQQQHVHHPPSRANNARSASTMSSTVRSLYRRSMRVAASCVPEHRDWMAAYIRQRFRDDALVRGGSQTMLNRMREAEDEIERMLIMLQATGRLSVDSAAKLRAGADVCAARLQDARSSASPSVPSTAVPGDGAQATQPTEEWDEETVAKWLRKIGLGHHAEAFLRQRVDGRLLIHLDLIDLKDELSVDSRLERKKIVAHIAALRSAN